MAEIYCIDVFIFMLKNEKKYLVRADNDTMLPANER